MSRFATLVAVLLIAGCSSPQKRSPILTDSPDPPDDSSGDRGGLVEAEGCAVPPPSTMPTMQQMELVGAVEQSLTEERRSYGAHCGAAVQASHHWAYMFRSAGYDEGESIDPIGETTRDFMAATKAYCEGPNGGKYRDAVYQVVVTPTDNPDRVGVCVDSHVLVIRIMLEPGSDAITHWTGDQIVEWFEANL